MTIHVIPIPSGVTYGTPAQVYTTSNAAGVNNTAMRTDSEVAVFDATLPASLSFGGSSSVGSAAFASRRDHGHGLGSPSLELVATAVADDSASLIITGLNSDYDSYLIVGADLKTPDNASAYLRVGDSSGIDSGATDYAYYGHSSRANDATDVIYNAGSASYIKLNSGGIGGATGEGFGFSLTLLRPGDGTVFPIFSGSVATLATDAVLAGGQLVGQRKSVITLDRIQLILATGHLVSGRLTVYGQSFA